MGEKFNSRLMRKSAVVLGIFVLVALIGLGGYKYDKLRTEYAATLAELGRVSEEKSALEQNVRDQQYALESLQKNVSNIGSTVGTLQKLSQTDEELLKKYSKIYFLNENYVPAELSDIDAHFAYGDKKLLIHAEVKPFLRNLLTAAEDAGVDLAVASAFRSFDTQANLKYSYTITYGAGSANQFSADQGYSEHQLGTAVDFTTQAIGGNFSLFEKSAAYQWLLGNAYKYGFTISYPKNNTYYKFEPWHWRFVGVELATRLHNEGKYFYDLDQREIDTYLVKLFDQ